VIDDGDLAAAFNLFQLEAISSTTLWQISKKLDRFTSNLKLCSSGVGNHLTIVVLSKNSELVLMLKYCLAF